MDQSVVTKTEEMGKRVGSSTDGISKSIGRVSEANKDLEQTTKRTSDVSKTQTNALGQLTAGYESLSGSLSKSKNGCGCSVCYFRKRYHRRYDLERSLRV